MGKFEEQTGRSIETAFAEFHAKNPIVYDLFKEQVFRAIRKNRSKISSKQIIGYLRWEVSFQVDNQKDEFKINDAFTSRYARIFVMEHPQYEDIFNFRELRSGIDPIEKKILTSSQVTALILIERGNLFKIGRSLNISYENEIRPLDVQTFNRLKKLKYIELSNDSSPAVERYQVTETGKKFLSAHITEKIK